MIQSDIIEKNYENARKIYRSYGVDTELVMEKFRDIPISMHCWQGDDIRGFEKTSSLGENIITSHYPGAARNGDELRMDIETVFSMIPSRNRVSLHTIYGEPDQPRERCDYTPEDFRRWIDWAKKLGIGLDYHPTFFAHPQMAGGFSLASPDKSVRDYWVKVGQGAREIAAAFGRELGTPSWNNLWIPDGMKDLPANRLRYREYLKESLDQIYAKPYEAGELIDVVESKLFGIDVESYTVGSYDFYLAYALKNNIGVCLNTGHYLSTESVADKMTAIGPFLNHILLHVTRGVHWDSGHVAIHSEELDRVMSEIKRAGYFEKVGIGLDFLDAGINRIAAWIIGMRAVGRSLLGALLEPTHLIRAAEAEGDYTSRLALMEEFQNLPANAVWDMLCYQNGVPVGTSWIANVKQYEDLILSRRK